MAPAPDGFWTVRCSSVIADRLRQIQAKANRQGRGKKAVDAIRKILYRLRTAPQEFGEPLYRLPVLKMQIRQAVIRPLAVNFGVCEEQPLVFLNGIRLLGPGKDA
jgi:hypothetical protein